VECERCNENLRNLHNKEDAQKVVDNLLLIGNHQKYNFHNTGTAQECYDEENYFNPQCDYENRCGCVISIFYFLICFLIFKYLW
jgi:hypothetical protein